MLRKTEDRCLKMISEKRIQPYSVQGLQYRTVFDQHEFILTADYCCTAMARMSLSIQAVMARNYHSLKNNLVIFFLCSCRIRALVISLRRVMTDGPCLLSWVMAYVGHSPALTNLHVYLIHLPITTVFHSNPW